MDGGKLITLRAGQVPMNLEITLTAVVTLCPAKVRPLRSRIGMSQLGIQ